MIMIQEQFKFDNYSLQIGKEWFKWKILISNDEPDEKLDKIIRIEYRLPESFPDPIRIVENRDSRFALDSTGGYEIPIFITIYLKDNNELFAKYHLDLNKHWPTDELKGIDLKNADLNGVNLTKANLSKANLRNANLMNANLSDADLTNANLVSANLRSANLKGAELYNTDLRKAKLWYADLSNARLQKANLRDAVLYNAILIDANLENVNLFNAGLQRAHLQGANLKNAYLKGATFENAFFDQNTNFEGIEYDPITIFHLKGSNWSDANWDPWVLDEIKKKHGEK